MFKATGSTLPKISYTLLYLNKLKLKKPDKSYELTNCISSPVLKTIFLVYLFNENNEQSDLR